MTRATNGQLHTLCCDLLYGAQTGWVNRRKETAELLTEGLLKHRLSLDFDTSALPFTNVEEEFTVAFVPLVLLRKEPGTFTCFDLVDESGTSLPLPDRARNAAVSAGVLIEAANRVLSPGKVSDSLASEFRFIANARKNVALAAVQGAYSKPEAPFSKDTDAGARADLWADPRFQWLLLTLARSSVVVISLPLDGRPRRIVKLEYDEHIADVTHVGAQDRFRLKLRALLHRFGWRGYLLVVYSPFVGASSYHFELHAPEGTELVAAGIRPSQHVGRMDTRRVHLYAEDARALQSSVTWAQMRVRGPGFVGPAALTALVITLSLIGAAFRAPQLHDSATSAPSLLLLFPGLVGSYLARPAHPLVSRLLVLARWTLALCAFLAFAGAGRMAVVSHDHPASVGSLTWWFASSAVVASLCTAALFASWFLPRRTHETPKAATEALG